MHIANWYTTLAKLAGAEFPEHDELGPYTHKDGVPNVDGVNVWWYLVGENETSSRTELVFKEWGGDEAELGGVWLGLVVQYRQVEHIRCSG